MTEIDQRRRALSARLPELKIDALLVSAPANVRYLTGFAGSNGILLITKDESHFFTDPRYALVATAQITCRVHIEKKALMVAAMAVIKRMRLKKIGFESSSLRYDDYTKVKEELPLGSGLQPIGRIIEEQRMVKSAAEISLWVDETRRALGTGR